jgi:hypothetical protein
MDDVTDESGTAALRAVNSLIDSMLNLLHMWLFRSRSLVTKLFKRLMLFIVLARSGPARGQDRLGVGDRQRRNRVV